MCKTHSEYTLKKSTEHLYYEIDMFYTTLLSLTSVKNQVEVNVLLDAFAIHTRNLFDFFYPKKSNRDDDMIVTDFPINLSKFNRLKIKREDLLFVVKKTDKQVAHLTYARNRYSRKSKSWPFLDIGRKMYKNIYAFYDTLPNNYKNLPNIRCIKNVLDQLLLS